MNINKEVQDFAQKVVAYTNERVARAESRYAEENARLKSVLNELCELEDVDNYGNLLKKVRTRSGRVLHGRLPFLSAAPHTWRDTILHSQFEPNLNRLDKKVRHLLSLTPERDHAALLEILADNFRTMACEDFSDRVVGLLAEKVHGAPPVAPEAPAEADQPALVSYLDHLQSPFITEHLNERAVADLSAAPRTRTHATITSLNSAGELETAQPLKRGGIARAAAIALTIDTLFPDADPRMFSGTDEGIAFECAFGEGHDLVDVLNRGGMAMARETYTAALEALIAEDAQH